MARNGAWTMMEMFTEKFPAAATMNGGSIRLAARLQIAMLFPSGHAPAISCCRMRSVGSIAAGEYKDYYTETIKLHRNGVYATYTYCFEGSELSCILMESAGGMMNNIDLKPTADEAVIAIPPVDRVMKD